MQKSTCHQLTNNFNFGAQLKFTFLKIPKSNIFRTAEVIYRESFDPACLRLVFNMFNVLRETSEQCSTIWQEKVVLETTR